MFIRVLDIHNPMHQIIISKACRSTHVTVCVCDNIYRYYISLRSYNLRNVCIG